MALRHQTAIGHMVKDLDARMRSVLVALPPCGGITEEFTRFLVRRSSIVLRIIDIRAGHSLEITLDYRATGRAMFDPEVSCAWSAGRSRYTRLSFEQNACFANYFTARSPLVQGVIALYDNGQLRRAIYNAWLNWFGALAAYLT